MVLTEHLHGDSPITRWAQQYDWTPVTRQVADAATDTGYVPQHSTRDAYAEVGGILSRRVEVTVEPAPPYAALAAAVGRGTISATMAGELARLYPTHEHSIAGTTLALRPTPRGWADLPTSPTGARSDVRGRAGLAHAIGLDAGAHALTSATADVLHATRAVAALEGEYRTVRRSPQTDELLTEPRADDAVLADVTALEQRSQRLVRQLAHITHDRRLRGHAAPCIVPQWADGDVLVGPHEHGRYALLDVKTVGRTSLRSAEKVSSWLVQLLAYAAADVWSTWRIDSVGLVLPRQDRVMVWPIGELHSQLGISGEGAVALRDAVDTAYRADSGGSSLHSDAIRVGASPTESTVR